MEHIMKSFVFLAFTLSLASAATHSLQYFYTAVTPGINFAEFTIVGLVDGGQFVYYDSNAGKMTPKTEWIQKVVGDEPGYWDIQTQNAQGTQETYKVNVATAMQRFNQSGGVHTWQFMCGCVLNEDGTKDGYWQYGYDGDDFINLDKNTLTWTAPKPEAVITKQKWEKTGDASYGKSYLENTCIEWLQKYVEYGKSTLERKVPPKVDLFQKDSSSPVVCHTTGFFPSAVMISWQKNGEDHHEDVVLGETLVNEDGTFQKRSVLIVQPEELERNKYTCIIQHAGLKQEMVLNASDRRVPVGGVSVGVIIAVVAVLLLVIIGCVGLFIWKKKSGFKPVSQNASEDSGSNKS
ncbi:patr class I histocompatibility antigen, B-1 alpha chain-like [Hoplias malabaricus]|uniref:patr class I histocompatibility antigen, B-1 alpha chain-like n=1 Tax=Hoplias malabaricus TaxID=27720 RepID=UPI003461E3D2